MKKWLTLLFGTGLALIAPNSHASTIESVDQTGPSASELMKLGILTYNGTDNQYTLDASELKRQFNEEYLGTLSRLVKSTSQIIVTDGDGMHVSTQEGMTEKEK